MSPEREIRRPWLARRSDSIRKRRSVYGKRKKKTKIPRFRSGRKWHRASAAERSSSRAIAVFRSSRTGGGRCSCFTIDEVTELISAANVRRTRRVFNVRTLSRLMYYVDRIYIYIKPLPLRKAPLLPFTTYRIFSYAARTNVDALRTHRASATRDLRIMYYERRESHGVIMHNSWPILITINVLFAPRIRF